MCSYGAVVRVISQSREGDEHVGENVGDGESFAVWAEDEDGGDGFEESGVGGGSGDER